MMTEQEIKTEIIYLREILKYLLHAKEQALSERKPGKISLLYAFDLRIAVYRGKLQMLRQVINEMGEEDGSDPAHVIKSRYLATAFTPMTACNHQGTGSVCRCNRMPNHKGMHRCRHNLKWIFPLTDEVTIVSKKFNEIKAK